MNRGYIKVWRAIWDNSQWNHKPFERMRAWIDLLLLANYKDSFYRKRGNRIDVFRGQIGRSIKELSDRWGWSEGKVNRFLSELEIDEQIEVQKTNLTTLITILNYEKYQGDGEQIEPQTAHKRSADGAQTETYNKVKKVNKEKKLKSLNIYATNFETFWEAYPLRNGRRTGKPATLKRFNQIPEADYELLITATNNYASSQQALSNFAKDPERFLKDDYWRDWIEPGDDKLIKLSSAGRATAMAAQNFLREDKDAK